MLFGQPELDKRLSQHHMRQLLQRISFSAALEPMTFSEASAYIDYRMNVQGVTSQVFNFWAKRQIWRASEGTPRLIHQLCHKALLLSFSKGENKVTWRQTQLAIKDTPLAQRRSWFRSFLGRKQNE